MRSAILGNDLKNYIVQLWRENYSVYSKQAQLWTELQTEYSVEQCSGYLNFVSNFSPILNQRQRHISLNL